MDPKPLPPHGTGPLGARDAHRLCVAPMMDWTDRHFRVLLRLLGPDLVLYTEMITARALLHGDAAGLLRFHDEEHPVALQLGGSEPEELARAAILGAEAGYDEINLNCGCPSDRVSAGAFGAALMAEPARVADCVAAMSDAVTLPITVKCRLGIIEGDDRSHASRPWFDHFIDRVAASGCTLFVVHARDAVLGGLSPKENREVPPLRHDDVRALAARRPDLEIILNGGINTEGEAIAACSGTGGVMVGRAAVNDTCVLARMHQALLGHGADADPRRLIEGYLPHVQQEVAEGVPLTRLTRLLSGVFHGVPGARAARRLLAEGAGAGDPGIIQEALECLRPERTEAA